MAEGQGEGAQRTMSETSTTRPSIDPSAWHDHYLVCGWHGGVPVIVRQLTALAGGRPSVALVNEAAAPVVGAAVEQLQRDLAGQAVVAHVSGNPADSRTLQACAAARARAAILVSDEAGGPAPGADDRVFRYAIALREVSDDLVIVAEVRSPERVQYLRNAGANEVEVRDTRLPFYLVASSRSPGLGPAARQLFGSGSTRAVRKEPVPEPLWGRTLAETRDFFRRERAGLVIGVITDPEELSVRQVLSAGSDWVRGFIDRMLAESGQDVLAEARGTRQVRLNPPDSYVITPRDSAIVIPTGG